MAEEEQRDVEQSEPQAGTEPEPPAEEQEGQAAEATPEPEEQEAQAAEAAAEPGAAEVAEAEAEAAAEQPVEAAPAEPAERVRPRKKRLPRSQRRQRTQRKREKPAERRPIVRLPKPEREPGRRQERRGVVVSSAMDKTIVVQVETVKAHPRYKKVVRRSRRFHAHDAENAANVGDVVRIVESRPLSKMKTWRLAEIVEQAR
jgi:small subunit ribosomal protein S17